MKRDRGGCKQVAANLPGEMIGSSEASPLFVGRKRGYDPG